MPTQEEGVEVPVKRKRGRPPKNDPNRAPPKKKVKRVLAEEDMLNGEELFCICKKPNDPAIPMIECEFCDDWYHLPCIEISIEEAKRIKHYKCNLCIKEEEEAELEQQRQAQLAALKPVRHKCALHGCKNFGRAGSAFCKDACGMEAARLKLRNIELLEKIRQQAEIKRLFQQLRDQFGAYVQTNFPELASQFGGSNRSAEHLAAAGSLPGEGPSACQAEAFLEDLKEIDTLHATIASTQKQIETLRVEQTRMEEYIASVPDLPVDNDPPRDTDKRNGDIIDCPSCGHPISVTRYVRHVDSCVTKIKTNESYVLNRTVIDDTHTVMLCNHFDPRTRSYCSRLKATCHVHQEHARKKRTVQSKICGCPLSEDFSEYCRYLRKECLRHTLWEKLKVSDLIQQISSHELQKQWQSNEVQAMETTLLRKLGYPVPSS